MAGFKEILRQIVNFRLIQPGFDGDSELRKFLGIPTSGVINTTNEKPQAKKPLKPIDKETLDMIEHLKNGKKESDLDAGPGTF